MKQELQSAFALSNNEKAAAIAKYSDTLDEAIKLFKDNCQLLVGVDWNKYVEVLFIMLNIPLYIPYLPQLDLQVPNYKSFTQDVKLKFVLTFELYCQVYFIEKDAFAILIELINRHLGLPKPGKYLFDTELMIDIMIYGKWWKYGPLKAIVNDHIKHIKVPSLYLKEPLYIKSPIAAIKPINLEAIQHIQAIFPDLKSEHISQYLEYFNHDIEQVVVAAMDNNLPSLALLPIHANPTLLQRNETADILQRQQSDVDLDIKQLTLDLNNQQEIEAQELEDDTYADGLFETRVIGEEEDVAKPALNNQEKTEQVLVECFMQYGESLFVRENRKNPLRLEVLHKLQWSHEQLEGWYIMIKKRPQLLDLLQEKYIMQRKNIKTRQGTEVVDDVVEQPPSNRDPTSQRARGRGRGRGKRKFRGF